MQTLDIPAGERQVVVYLFADQNRYANYMKERHPDLPARRAFFIGTPRELAVYAFWGEQTMVDLRHEFTHGFLHASLGNVPLWVDEGLAEYFEVGSRAPGSINGEHLPRLQVAVQNGWRPDVHRLEQLEDVDEMHREDYQEAWLWVHYLMHKAPRGQAILSEYLNDLHTRRSGDSLAKRIEKELPTAEVVLTGYVETLSR